MPVRGPTSPEEKKMIAAFSNALNSPIFKDCEGRLHPLICSVCDTIAHVDISMEWMAVTCLHWHCHRTTMTKTAVQHVYPADLIAQYTVPQVSALARFVLSPKSVFDATNDCIAICTPCANHFRLQEELPPSKRFPPKEAIIAAYLIGDAPSVLTDLNQVELALLSTVRTNCQSWIYFAGCHQHIQGWHTFYEGRPASNVATISSLSDAGLRGQLLVVLCGPFTTTQAALARRQTLVNAAKVIAAFEWLKINNYHYRDIAIPLPEDLPIPQIIDDDIQYEDSRNTTLENEIRLTVLFPDNTLTPSLNGGFASQDEFRNFVMQLHQEGKMDASLHARPTQERVPDYNGEALAKAFPLVFPFGHSGCAQDPAFAKIEESSKIKGYLKRSRPHVLQKYLRHRKSACHEALFNLIVGNILMKLTIFKAARIQANFKFADGVSYGERFGGMNADQLRRAVNDVRNDYASQFSSNPEAQYLRSIHATCRDLPHSNEASLEARKIYFSYLMQYGLPAVFLTVTPDDGRNHRIVLYAVSPASRASLPALDVANVSDEDIMVEFKMRQQCRTSYPGLCAEEYHRIMTLVIKHLFQWDETTQTSTGQGCFGTLKAWCLATEEQGRKTLHGHFLLFLHDWAPLMRRVQLRDPTVDSVTAQRELTKFCANISSARLFADFARPNGLLYDQSPFHHEHCTPMRGGNNKRKHFDITPAPEQILREMRHKRLCKDHQGYLGQCPRCAHKFSVNDIVTTALQCHLGSSTYQYPDTNRRLEYFVYHSQQDIDWFTRSDKAVAIRYFAHNALVNIHHPCHANRCFKKSAECFANLPEMPSEFNTLHFKEGDPDAWYDFTGAFEPRYMFRFYPQRNIEDAFMNVHSPVLTKCFANNTNVLAAMNGPVVYYVTGYQAKQQQKEERSAYQKVSETIGAMLTRANNDDRTSTNNDDATDVPPSVQGLRRLLAGIYTQTSAHIVAAPMAHFLALHGSRFRFSHDNQYLPVIGIENYLLGEATTRTMRMRNGIAIWYHRAMDYLFRPKELDHLSMLRFCRETQAIWTKEATRNDIECFAYLEGHPFQDTYSIRYRLNHCVVTFPWQWLRSTAEFEHPLTVTIASTHRDFAEREEYCRRFLMLFIPFRALNELRGDSATYQEAFAHVVSSNAITDDVMTFANNIQDIHNSIRVTMPTNRLVDCTQLDDETLADTPRGSANTAEQEAYLMATIASLLAETALVPNPLERPATSVTPMFGGSTDYMPRLVLTPADAVAMMHANTVVYETLPSPIPRASATRHRVADRFVPMVSQLNTLVYTGLVTPEDGLPTNLTANATGSAKSIVEWCTTDRLDTNQQVAVEIMAATYVLTFHEDANDDTNGVVATQEIADLRRLTRQRPGTDEKLRMFITGPAGAGKSRILETLLAYCKAFSKNLGHHFTRDTIRLSAMTGSAGVEIGGDTTAREFGLNCGSVKLDDIERFKDTRLNIVDEASFASMDNLEDLSQKLQEYTQCNTQIYGNIAMVFIGDFCQLPAIGGKKIYECTNSIYWEQTLNQLVELGGHHRYADDPALGTAMASARNGDATDLRTMLRTREMKPNKLTLPPGLDARYATFTNMKRASINANIFRQYLQTYHHTDEHMPIPHGALIIRGAGVWGTTGQPLHHAAHKIFWETCSDAHVKIDQNGSQMADPFLCLFFGCELMVNDNIAVKDGIANGTCCQFVKAILKHGANVTPIQVHGSWVNAVDITEVVHIILRFDVSYEPKFKGTFKLKPRSRTFTVSYPTGDLSGTSREWVRIKLTHFPILGNFATTGHKLQGKTMANLVIAEWINKENWAYVVLSRVRTLAGLFLVDALPDDVSFAPPQAYLEMMERMRTSILATPLPQIITPD